MTAVFADTFYWVALTDPDDALYKQAAELESRFALTSIVTTDEVLSEVLMFSRANATRAAVVIEPLFQGTSTVIPLASAARRSFWSLVANGSLETREACR
jgi:predicted nucleic acid-binding protein